MKYWFYSYIFPNKDGGVGFGNAFQKGKYFMLKDAVKFQKEQGRDAIVLNFIQVNKEQLKGYN